MKDKIFFLNFVSGEPYPERQQAHGQLKESMMILVSGLSYSQPEYSLGAESAFYPTLPPLTWPNYKIGPIAFGSFREINVVLRDGQSANSNNDLFSEMNDSGSMKSLLSCSKMEKARSPLCKLHENVDGWETLTTFFRDQISKIDTIRTRRDEFIECISWVE
ncbi:hypothetical protein [Paenirhodobacter sp.]|uniref:hypothetical protein n=1 Tax=Paenirhodobacter sp. TaxID=1965326 RepID=UPI003B4071E3